MTYTEAYMRYYPFVFKLCKKLSADEHTAKDATQETMYKLMMHWDDLYEKESLEAWLGRVDVLGIF